MSIDAPVGGDLPALIELATRVGRSLESHGWMIATAESCTAGLIGWALTETGGSSAWYERGFVTYSNAAKQELLGVTAATLAAHGAVSEPTAREMAAGALARSAARIALSVTGIAGPGGGSPGRPVGTVCFGWASAGRIETARRHFDGDRAQVRLQAALFALARVPALLPRPGDPSLIA